MEASRSGGKEASSCLPHRRIAESCKEKFQEKASPMRPRRKWRSDLTRDPIAGSAIGGVERGGEGAADELQLTRKSSISVGRSP